MRCVGVQVCRNNKCPDRKQRIKRDRERERERGRVQESAGEGVNQPIWLEIKRLIYLFCGFPSRYDDCVWLSQMIKWYAMMLHWNGFCGQWWVWMILCVCVWLAVSGFVSRMQEIAFDETIKINAGRKTTPNSWNWTTSIVAAMGSEQIGRWANIRVHTYIEIGFSFLFSLFAVFVRNRVHVAK